MRTRSWGRASGQNMFLTIFVAVLFVVGVVFGAMVYQALTLEQQEYVTGEVGKFAKYMDAGYTTEPAETFRERAAFHAKWIGLIWVLGITVAGVPFVLALDFLKGTLIGFTVGTLIQGYGWKGAAFALASVAPPNLIIIPSLLIASVSALHFAIHVVKKRFLTAGGELLQPALIHTALCLAMLLCLWGAAGFEAYLSPWLIKWAAQFLIVV